MGIGYKIFGSGYEKVLVMHNWFGDSSSYELMLPHLDAKRFTYLFMDLRGYGLSKSIHGKYTVEEASKDALNLIHSLGWKHFHVVGHSMSGMIAQKIGLDASSMVKSIVAITPVPACGTPKPPELMAFLEDAALSNDEKAIECVHLLTRHQHSDEFVRKIVNSWRKCSTPEARIAYLHMFSNTDFSDSVKRLKTPMLVIYGEYDFEDEEALMRRTFLEWYPNAQLECCKNAGHFPMLEAPVPLAGTIEKFLCSYEN
jgi:pimeloyl-ACP methyl ester carboxylesterase